MTNLSPATPDILTTGKTAPFLKWGAALLTILMAGVAPASGAFVLLDDFEAYTTGSNINGQGSWSANTVSGTNISTVAANPSGAGKVLSMPGYTSTTSNYVFNNSGSINIANGTTGTFFYQFYFSNTNALNLSHGLADISPGVNDFGPFEVQVRNGNALGGTTPLPAEHNDMYVRDAGAFEGLTAGTGGPETELTAGVWYNLWLVADNSADTFEVYLQSDQDANYASQTLMNSTGADAFNFRSGTSAALSAFYAINALGTSQNVYFDNFYVDNSGINLANPVPEPGSMALLSVALLARLMIRSRPRSRR